MTLKTFKTAAGQVGRFLLDDLRTLDDCYVVGGCEYPFAVLGEHTIDDFVEQAPASIVPAAVTMRQARLALLQAGKLSAVNAAIAGMSGAQGEAAKIEWEFSNEVQRAQPLIAALAPVLGMTPAQIDQLFITAARL